MLQHVYPKCSSKLPQQLTSNCPGRSGLEVHVASTSAFSINDLRWLALNIINQNDSKLHNQRVKYLTLEFHPISFFRFLTINDAQPFTVLWHIFRHDLGRLSTPKGRFQDDSCSQRIGMDWWLFQLIPPKLDGINWFQSNSMFPNKHTNKLEIIENHQKNPSLQVAVSIRWTQHARWFLFQAFYTSNTSRSFFGVWGEGRVYGSDVGRGLSSRKSGWQRHISIWKEPQKAWWCAMPAVMRKL